jgi:phage shock protein A
MKNSIAYYEGAIGALEDEVSRAREMSEALTRLIAGLDTRCKQCRDLLADLREARRYSGGEA